MGVLVEAGREMLTPEHKCKRMAIHGDGAINMPPPCSVFLSQFSDKSPVRRRGNEVQDSKSSP